jgi:invasion protein IalB
MNQILAVLTGALLCATVSHAFAQHRQAQPAQNEGPQRTTASYNDWIVQCETTAQPPHQKICEMTQNTQIKGENLPFSRVSLSHLQKSQPIKMVVQVPVNASFRTNVRIRTGDADPGIAAPFARCMPSGCFAEFDIKDNALKKLRAAAGAGKLTFADAGGREVTVPLSFKGFNQAFDALLKE